MPCEREAGRQWGKETAVVRLDADADRSGPEALAGPDGFSHPEFVHHFGRVPVKRIETGARHPRGNTG
ncbi:hypothetical protein [Streptomyces sp. NRRL B-24085]|uniref:hypothetical protein n=1 Tax=Streptomyces sp. NRRL B-24085 TaxID=1709476 RepID=UPI000B14B816|nr:hypothetical protein [Streptomyces sp. NRRL B-24085]